MWVVAIPRICELVQLVSNYVHRLAKINFKLISQNHNLRKRPSEALDVNLHKVHKIKTQCNGFM